MKKSFESPSGSVNKVIKTFYVVLSCIEEGNKNFSHLLECSRPIIQASCEKELKMFLRRAASFISELATRKVIIESFAPCEQKRSLALLKCESTLLQCASEAIDLVKYF